MDAAQREESTLERLVAESGRSGPLTAYGDLPDQVWEDHGDAHDPTVVVVHGGYWRPRTDRTHARPMAAALAATGLHVVLAEYRRVPGDPGATVEDLAALADRLDGADRLWIGHSAGGCLALARGLDPARMPVPVLALAPVADLVRAARERLGDDAVLDWVGARPEVDPAAYERLDPAQLAARSPERWPEMMLLHGADDVAVPVSQSADSALPHQIWEGAHHMDLIDPESPHWPDVVDRVHRMMRH